MGQVFMEEAPLAAVLGQAEAAVVVTLGTPAMTPVEIPVPGSATKKCGTYSYGAWHATVVEVVAARPGVPPLAVGGPITVFPANTSALVGLTQRACLEGGSKSPIFFEYAGDGAPDGATRVVLLDWEPPYGFVEAVSGAWLDPARKGEVALDTNVGVAEIEGPEDALCLTDADCTWAPKSCACPRCGPPRGFEPAQIHAAAGQQARCAADGPVCAPCDGAIVAPPVACVAMRCVAR